MRQGINLNFVRKRRNGPDRSLREALILCRNSGFSLVDYLSAVETPDWREQAERTREEMAELGIRVHQSHCPFFRYRKKGRELFEQYAPRAVKAAEILGAKFLVIHADECRSEDSFDSGEILRETCALLAPVVELCVKAGIRPAIENLFEDGFGPQFGGRSRFTAVKGGGLALLGALRGTGIGCCWDSGHALCSYGEGAPEELEKLSDHLLCTHMHDNSCRQDQHKPAYFGSLNWERVIEILKRSGYSGDWTWEFVYERFPDELLPEFLRFVHQTGEYLIRSGFPDGPGAEKEGA